MAELVCDCSAVHLFDLIAHFGVFKSSVQKSVESFMDFIDSPLNHLWYDDAPADPFKH